jgi:Tol biopolymer transport system component
MMKNSICLLSFSLLAIVIVTAVYAMDIRNMDNKLSGCIEILVDNNTIKIIELATGKIQDVLSQEHGNYLYSFDTSHSGKEKVIETDEGLFVYTADDKKLKRLIKKNSSTSVPSFSPDGTFIAYLSTKYKEEHKYRIDDRYLYVVKHDGSSDRQVSNLSCVNHKPSWFPDGKRIAIGSKDFGIYIIDIITGDGERIIDFGTSPSVSHDGKKIIYLSKEVDASVKSKMINYQIISMKEYQDVYMSKNNKKEEGQLSTLFYSYTFYIYDISSGRRNKISDEIFISPYSSLIWSPDDKYILYTDNKYEHHQVNILNIETMNKEKITYGVAMGFR